MILFTSPVFAFYSKLSRDLKVSSRDKSIMILFVMISTNSFDVVFV